MTKDKSFIKLLKYYGIFLIITMGVIIAIFDIITSAGEFKERKAKLESLILEQKKELIKGEVNYIVALLNYEKKNKINLLKSKIKHRVYEAINIAEHLYKKYYQQKTEKEIQEMILEALRPIRYYPIKKQKIYKDVGYYFAVSMDGTELLFADKPEMEGKNMLTIKDCQGRYVVKEMIKIAQKKGEGFYEYCWSKPFSKGFMHKKISFIKLFKPLNFIIGTGMYIEDIDTFLKNKIKKYINLYRFGKDKKGYIFVNKIEKNKNQIKTIRLINPNKPLKDIGKVIPLNLKDAKGKMFNKEMVEKALNNGEGFVTYYFKKFKSNKISKKITFIKYYPEWHWMIASGVYLDDIEKEIAVLKSSLYKETKIKLIHSIITIFIIVLIFLILINKLSSIIKNDFNMFFNFFKESVKHNKPLNLSEIKFIEFREMAEKANKMLKEKIKFEISLKEEKEKFFVTLQSIGDAVITTDINGYVELMNPIAEKLTGWEFEEAKGKPLSEIFKIVNESTREPVENPVEKVLKSNRIVGIANHTILISRNGKEYNIADSAAPIKDSAGNILGVILVFRDVTEKLKMEKELLKIEKIKSIGVLAGGLAHDFNNILTGVFGNLELAMLKIAPEHSAYSILDKSFKSLERARHITQQLLLFSKGNEPIIDTINLESLIEETVRFNLSGTKIKPIIEIEKDLWFVKADKGHISHLLANLVINASQAMPEGGRLFISCKNVELNKGKFVRLQIKDEGIGIPKKYLDKIFEPYFTTKKDGSGLGLSIVYNIVNKHNGFMEIESEEGKGTTFTIFLPAEDAMLEKKGKLENKNLKTDFSGNVLLMDDEEMVRETIKEMLSSFGFTVITSKDGEEAIEIYKELIQKGEKIVFAIMDLTVPGGMGGKEAIKEILKIDRDAKVIVSSGYSEDDVISNYKKYGFKGRIIKPFTIANIKKEIVRILK